ncbi:MAG: efflux RND transporter periplasmic adaptor subunit [Acidobacteriota bacterium]
MASRTFDRQRLTTNAVAACLLGLAFLMSCHSGAADQPAAEAPTPQRVQIAEVETSTADRLLRFSGTLRAASRAQLSFPLAARIAERPVEIGDEVRRGQLLARLDDREIRNNLATAEATLDEIEARQVQVDAELGRVRQLAAAKAATDQELDSAEAAASSLQASLDAASARRQEARRLLSETRMTAPYAGVVTAIHMEPGEMASPGRTVLEVSGAGNLEVEVGVPERLVPQLKEGEGVTLELPLSSQGAVQGTLRSIGRVAAGVGSLFPVVVEVPGQGTVAAGMTAEVLLPAHSDAQLTVPLAAVLNPGGSRPSVFQLVDAPEGPRVRKVAVEVDRLVNGRVAVSGELDSQQPVVVAGHSGLLDGQAVEVVR